MVPRFLCARRAAKGRRGGRPSGPRQRSVIVGTGPWRYLYGREGGAFFPLYISSNPLLWRLFRVGVVCTLIAAIIALLLLAERGVTFDFAVLPISLPANFQRGSSPAVA